MLDGYTKMLLAIIIFFVGLNAAFLPYISNRFTSEKYRPSNTLRMTDLFSRGVFVGIAAFHLIPDALHQLAYLSHPIVLTTIIAALIISLILSVDIVLQKQARKHPGFCHHWIAYPTVLLLSIHSFFAGIALGFSQAKWSIIFIGLALAIHKAAAAYSLGSLLQETMLKMKRVFFFIILFSISTPLGILTAGHLSSIMDGAMHYIPAASVGLFIYLGLTYNDSNSIKSSHRRLIKINTISSGLAFIFGLGLMSALALIT